MLAEIVKHFYPRLVDLHNYVPTCNTDQKLSNWSVLNRQASLLSEGSLSPTPPGFWGTSQAVSLTALLVSQSHRKPPRGQHSQVETHSPGRQSCPLTVFNPCCLHLSLTQQ